MIPDNCFCGPTVSPFFICVTVSGTNTPGTLMVEVLEVYGNFTIVQGTAAAGAGPAVSCSVAATSNYGLVLGTWTSIWTIDSYFRKYNHSHKL